MKIGEAKRVPALERMAPARGPGPAGAAAPATAQADSAAIMGIPATEITSKVRDAIMALLGEVARLREELSQTQSRVVYLERLADEDALVPVINRRAFVRELSRMMSFAERYTSPSSVLYFDLNAMKAINDTYGHAAGDAALSQVARILAEQIRESDIVGRLGGDECGVILAQSDLAQAHQKAAALIAAVSAEPLEWKGARIPLELAYGAYVFDGAESTDTVLDGADRAMYAHKHDTNGGR